MTTTNEHPLPTKVLTDLHHVEIAAPADPEEARAYGRLMLARNLDLDLSLVIDMVRSFNKVRRRATSARSWFSGDWSAPTEVNEFAVAFWLSGFYVTEATAVAGANAVDCGLVWTDAPVALRWAARNFGLEDRSWDTGAREFLTDAAIERLGRRDAQEELKHAQESVALWSDRGRKAGA